MNDQSTFNFYRTLIEDIGLSHFFQGLPDATVMKRMFSEFSKVVGCKHQFPDRETFAEISEILTEEQPENTLTTLDELCDSSHHANVDPSVADSIRYFLKSGSEFETSLQEAGKTELITIFANGIRQEFSKFEEIKNDLLREISNLYELDLNVVSEEKDKKRKDLQARCRQFLGIEGAEWILPSRDHLITICEAFREIDASSCKNRDGIEILLREKAGESFKKSVVTNSILSSALDRIIVAVVKNLDEQSDYHFSRFTEIAKSKPEELKVLLEAPLKIFIQGVDVLFSKRVQSTEALAKSFIDYYSLPAVSLILTLQTMVSTSPTR